MLNKKVHLGDNPNYDDRVRQLLADLEEQSNSHIKELNEVHETYRLMAAENTTLKEKFAQHERERQSVAKRERDLRMVITKLQLSNESLLKAFGKQAPPRPTDMLQSSVKTTDRNFESSYKQNAASYVLHSELDVNQQTIQSKDYHGQSRNSKIVPRKKDAPSDSNYSKSKQSEWSASRKASHEVLSNLCDKIQSVSGLMNAHVRRMFSLQEFVEPVDDEELDES